MKLKKPRDHAFDLNTTTLAQAQAFLRENSKAGALCPCCRQDVKMYDRPITNSMAYVLILLHRVFQTQKDWLHVPSYLTQMSAMGSAARGGDWVKLRYWGLIEGKKGERKDKSKRVGLYKITEEGHKFAKGEIKIPKYARIYNKKFLGFVVKETTSIQECLDTEFNYEDLMAGRLGTPTI